MEQKQHREMIERMEKAYTDMSYIKADVVKALENFEKLVNTKSATLVVICINKMYQIIFSYGQNLSSGKALIDTKSIKKLFVHVSHFS